METYDLIVITGPTATGKTSIAARLAAEIEGEIISADSRQVYRKMDLGTGKDLDDYIVNGKKIPFHLIDIAEPGYEYNVFEFQRDFFDAFLDIKSRGKRPILCGGTGMYIEAAISEYKLIEVPENSDLRKTLLTKTDEELQNILVSMRKLHNTSDTSDRKRLIRAIEIEQYYSDNPQIPSETPKINSIIFGINKPRDEVRERITKRLKQRLETGMIEEVELLLENGVTPEKLKYYGLEYKFLTQYILGEITYEQMFSQLNTAIHQFAKRQMTWFRRMEKKGFNIIWVESYEEVKAQIV
ncbi:MAG: tRNA (adenosine(37)-N6)-dimethylallyltransferase MiaA [Bacteroidetes bacterium]|nr:tRNA (adenosine(37)-N6)-dimethylallyltransferase MiaA [Bacteroidota bacterium]